MLNKLGQTIKKISYFCFIDTKYSILKFLWNINCSYALQNIKLVPLVNDSFLHL